MLIGILRWKEARQQGGVWWLLYTQVSLSHPARASSILMALGLGMGCGYHTGRTSSLGAYTVTVLYIFLMVGPLGPHHFGSEQYVNFLPIEKSRIQ
jgi:hypothetical protein